VSAGGIRVRLFAGLRDAVGAAEVTLDSDEAATAGALLHCLAERHPDAAPLLERSRVSVDREFAAAEDPVPPGAEVAVIPPVSGG
jgi:molybdopterin synthase catalytic subunit